MSGKLYSKSQIAALTGKSWNCVTKRLRNLGIEPVETGGHGLYFKKYTEEALEAVKNYEGLRRGPKKSPAKRRSAGKPGTYYRVCVLDFNSGRWFVKAAGLTRKDADALCGEYTAGGEYAVIKPCREEGKK